MDRVASVKLVELVELLLGLGEVPLKTKGSNFEPWGFQPQHFFVVAAGPLSLGRWTLETSGAFVFT